MKKDLLRPLQNQRGLSILEVLIAATILAIMGLTIVNVTNNSIETKEKVLSEDKITLQVETAMSILQGDFSQIYSPLFFTDREKKKTEGFEEGMGEVESSNKFEGNERFKFANSYGHPVPLFRAPDKQTLEFFTNSNRRRVENSKESNFAWVRYSVRNLSPQGGDSEEDDKDGKKADLELVRSIDAGNPYAPEVPEEGGPKSFVLLRNLVDFQFLYWDPKEKKFVESLEDVKDGKHVLRAIMVKFTWIDKNGRELEDERIFYSNWPVFEEKRKTSA